MSWRTEHSREWKENETIFHRLPVSICSVYFDTTTIKNRLGAYSTQSRAASEMRWWNHKHCLEWPRSALVITTQQEHGTDMLGGFFGLLAHPPGHHFSQITPKSTGNFHLYFNTSLKKTPNISWIPIMPVKQLANLLQKMNGVNFESLAVGLHCYTFNMV